MPHFPRSRTPLVVAFWSSSGIAQPHEELHDGGTQVRARAARHGYRQRPGAPCVRGVDQPCVVRPAAGGAGRHAGLVPDPLRDQHMIGCASSAVPARGSCHPLLVHGRAVAAVHEPKTPSRDKSTQYGNGQWHCSGLTRAQGSERAWHNARPEMPRSVPNLGVEPESTLAIQLACQSPKES